MKIAILGCGPSGLIAAHSAVAHGLADHDVKILSRKEKSPMPGAQFLHERIPGVTPYEPDGYLHFLKMGTAKGYAKKVYGDPDAPVSWDTYEEGHFPAWSLADTYDNLWEAWSKDIIDTDMGIGFIHDLAREYEVVFSSLPAPILCRFSERHAGLPFHDFKSAKVWFSTHAWRECHEDTIIYNGDPNDPWYRTSKIFGHESTEFSEATVGMHPLGVWSEGVKPVSHNCDCLPRNVIPIGRFGKWDKNTLVHHAFGEVRDALHALSQAS